jgi:hypothetical protein
MNSGGNIAKQQCLLCVFSFQLLSSQSATDSTKAQETAATCRDNMPFQVLYIAEHL